MINLCMSNGRVIDPAQNIDQFCDLWIRDERILGVAPHPSTQADHTLDATGKIVCRGLAGRITTGRNA